VLMVFITISYFPFLLWARKSYIMFPKNAEKRLK